MKLGKLTDGIIVLIDVEDGVEVGGSRTEAELYADGYKKACLMDSPSGDAVEKWTEYPTCWVQSWDEPMPEPDPDEITPEEALEIIIGGTEQ